MSKMATKDTKLTRYDKNDTKLAKDTKYWQKIPKKQEKTDTKLTKCHK